MRVLVIEDNRNLVANLFDYFEARGHVLDAAPDGVTGLHLASTRAHEIGRASCRERVCQYVEISVVAVSFKKRQRHDTQQSISKNKNKHTETIPTNTHK